MTPDVGTMQAVLNCRLGKSVANAVECISMGRSIHSVSLSWCDCTHLLVRKVTFQFGLGIAWYPFDVGLGRIPLGFFCGILVLT